MQQSNKGRFQSMLEGKCPRCHEGEIFTYPALKPGKFMKMNEKCSNCGQHFTPEPGFYFGAMYVAYAFFIALVVSVSVAINVLTDDTEFHWYIIIITGFNLILLPWIFRYSRLVFLYAFGGIKYQPNFRSK